jgi:hypothetical protein
MSYTAGSIQILIECGSMGSNGEVTPPNMGLNQSLGIN